MNKIKFTCLLAALASVFAFSSCLDSDSDSNYPMYRSVVTVGHGATVLYADNGAILRPTTQSLAAMPGLAKVERAIVSFDMADGSQQGLEPKPGKEYTVILNPGYGYSTALPTSKVIDFSTDAPADTLLKKNDPVNSLEASSVYARYGYLNANIAFNFSPSKLFTMNAAYDAEKDVDVKNKKFTLTVYYNSNSENSYQQGAAMFSFKLPSELRYEYTASDSVDVVLRYKKSSFNNNDQYQEATCRMAVSDFATRSFY